jgi:hypothetical protein
LIGRMGISPDDRVGRIVMVLALVDPGDRVIG